MIERIDLLKEVFDDKLVKIIKIFLSRPKKKFTLTKISEESGISTATTYRKLNNLISKDIIRANVKEDHKKTSSYSLHQSEKSVLLSKIFEN